MNESIKYFWNLKSSPATGIDEVLLLVVVVVVVVEEEFGAVVVVVDVSCEITDAIQQENQITEKLHCDHIIRPLNSNQITFY